MSHTRGMAWPSTNRWPAWKVAGNAKPRHGCARPSRSALLVISQHSGDSGAGAVAFEDVRQRRAQGVEGMCSVGVVGVFGVHVVRVALSAPS